MPIETQPTEAFILTAYKAGVPRDQLERFLRGGYVPLPWQLTFHAAAREADKRCKFHTENPLDRTVLDCDCGPVDLGAGGARGPGKSHGVFGQITIDDCQRVRGLKALFLRQTGKSAGESFGDLVEKVLMNKTSYTYNHSQNILRFPNGSRVLLGGFENEKDIDKYIGIEYDVIGVEERNQLTGEKILKLKGSLRTSKQGWRPRMYSSFNPGGIGHQDVKTTFVEPFRTGTETKTRFIPATYKENPYLNLEYIDYLEGLQGDLGRMWREGDWDIFAGQFFSEWRQEKHVIAPFELPTSWKRVRGIDVSGRSGITSCHWYAIDNDGGVIAYREHYKTGLDADQHAREIARLGHSTDCPVYKALEGYELAERKQDKMELEGLKEIIKMTDRMCMGARCEKYPYTVIDSAAFSKIGMPESIAEVYIRNGVTGLIPASKERIPGWDFVHQYLRWTNDLPPKLRYFSTCTNAIRTFPTLIHDEHNPEDLDTRGEDHAQDEVRYVLQTLREAKSPQPMSMVERRLADLKRQQQGFGFRR